MQCDIAMHTRQVFQSTRLFFSHIPFDLVGIGPIFRIFASVIVQYEALKKFVHMLVRKGRHTMHTSFRSHQRRINDKITQVHQHPITLIIPLKLQRLPSDIIQIDIGYIAENGTMLRN